MVKLISFSNEKMEKDCDRMVASQKITFKPNITITFMTKNLWDGFSFWIMNLEIKKWLYFQSIKPILSKTGIGNRNKHMLKKFSGFHKYE